MDGVSNMEVVRSVRRGHERTVREGAATLFRLSEMQRTSKATVPFYRVIYYIIPGYRASTTMTS